MPHRAGPVSVPALSHSLEFVTGARGRLYCIDRESHELVWSEQHDTPIAHGAFSPSPLLAGDFVIVSYTTEGVDVLQAFHVDDGEVAWTAEPELKREQEHGMVAVVHALPILATIFGQEQIVATHRRVTFGTDAQAGKLLWQYEGYRRGSTQAEVAVSPDGYMFFTSGHDGTSSLVHMSNEDNGYHFDVIYYDPRDLARRVSVFLCVEMRVHAGIRCVGQGHPLVELRMVAPCLCVPSARALLPWTTGRRIKRVKERGKHNVGKRRVSYARQRRTDSGNHGLAETRLILLTLSIAQRN
jgi:hypothetical protein